MIFQRKLSNRRNKNNRSENEFYICASNILFNFTGPHCNGITRNEILQGFLKKKFPKQIKTILVCKTVIRNSELEETTFKVLVEFESKVDTSIRQKMEINVLTREKKMILFSGSCSSTTSLRKLRVDLIESDSLCITNLTLDKLGRQISLLVNPIFL